VAFGARNGLGDVKKALGKKKAIGSRQEKAQARQ